MLEHVHVTYETMDDNRHRGSRMGGEHVLVRVSADGRLLLSSALGKNSKAPVSPVTVRVLTMMPSAAGFATDFER